jgi:hypothetical protein
MYLANRFCPRATRARRRKIDHRNLAEVGERIMLKPD